MGDENAAAPATGDQRAEPHRLGRIMRGELIVTNVQTVVAAHGVRGRRVHVEDGAGAVREHDPYGEVVERLYQTIALER